MLRFALRERAKDDVRDIRHYGRAQFGAQVARSDPPGRAATFELLRRRPLAGAPEPDLGYAVRGFADRSHPIHYRVEADRPAPRVLHHPRDARRRPGKGA